MNLFMRKRNPQAGVETAANGIDSEVLQDILKYAEQIALPAASGEVSLSLEETLQPQRKADTAKKGLYYLLIYAEQKAEGWLNAGYIAAQTAAYLRFQGFDVRLMREAQEHGERRADGRVCSAVLAFGRMQRREAAGKTQPQEERCICCGWHEDWAEKVLSLAGSGYPSGCFSRALAVRVLNHGNFIYIVPGAAGNKRRAAAALETGILSGSIMAAGEELWIDLAVFCPAVRRGAVCICRRQERSSVMNALAQEQDKLSAIAESVQRRISKPKWSVHLLRSRSLPDS